ncbi:unnamed protein product [Calypogeia fissa]
MGSSTPELERINDSIYVLYDPPKPTAQIIFFHDIHWREYEQPHWQSWMSDSRPSVCWPQAWLPVIVPHARILSACYDSGIWKGETTGHMDLHLLGENLRQDILPVYVESRPVFLIGHGLGGFVIKALIKSMDEELRDLSRGASHREHSKKNIDHKLESFLENVRGVMYYATPFLGSPLSDSTGNISNKGSLFPLLEILNTEASRLNNWFRRWRIDKSCQATAIFASLPTKVDQDPWYGSTHVAVEAAARYDALPTPLYHEVHEQLPGLRYLITDHPSWPDAVIHGFQHYIVNLGSIVLFTNNVVPLMGGDNEDKAKVLQTILFVSAMNTLIQTTLGSRLPVVMGVSKAYLLPIMSIINSPSLQTIADAQVRFKHTMKAIQGALILASSAQIVLGFSGIWGIVTRFLGPIAIAPLVALTALDIHSYGLTEATECVEIGLPTIILGVYFSQYLWHLRIKFKRRFHVFELFPILLVIVVVIWGYHTYVHTADGAYNHASVARQRNCFTDPADAIGPTQWARFAYPFEWGQPTFDAGHAFSMMSAVFVSMVESTGGFYAAYRLSGATPPPPQVISRGIGWSGVGILLNGVYGTAAGSTVSIENVGLLGITRVGSRRVIQMSAVWMALFSRYGKLGGFFASIPVSLAGGISSILVGTVAAVGISSLHFTNMNKVRNLFITGFALYMGFSVPFYFYKYTASHGYGPVHTEANWFNNIVNAFFSSGAVVALIVASILDNTVRIEQITPKDRGMHWFERFHEFTKDSRNEEFYSLPYILHRYFPPT